MLGFMYHENKINNLCLHNSMLDKYSIPRHLIYLPALQRNKLCWVLNYFQIEGLEIIIMKRLQIWFWNYIPLTVEVQWQPL